MKGFVLPPFEEAPLLGKPPFPAGFPQIFCIPLLPGIPIGCCCGDVIKPPIWGCCDVMGNMGDVIMGCWGNIWGFPIKLGGFPIIWFMDGWLVVAMEAKGLGCIWVVPPMVAMGFIAGCLVGTGCCLVTEIVVRINKLN